MAYFKNVELDRTDFDSEEDYNRALIEQNRIEKINQNVDITDPLVAKALLDGFRLHPEMFRTIVGNEFIEVLQENCKELEEEISVQQQAEETKPEEHVEESKPEEPAKETVEETQAEEPAEEPEQESVEEARPEEPTEEVKPEEPEQEPVEETKMEEPAQEPVEEAKPEEPEQEPVEETKPEEPAEEPEEETKPEEPAEEPEQEPVEEAEPEEHVEEIKPEEPEQEPVEEAEPEEHAEEIKPEEPAEELEQEPVKEAPTVSDLETEPQISPSDSKVEEEPAEKPESQANIEVQADSDTTKQVSGQVVSQKMMTTPLAGTSDLGKNSRMNFAIVLFIYSVVTVCFPVVGAGIAAFLFVIAFLHTFYRYYKTGMKPSIILASILCILCFPIGIILTIIGCMKKIKYIVLNYKILISAFLFYFIPVWLFVNLSMLHHGPMIHLIPTLTAMFIATGTYGKLAFLCNLFLGIAIGLYLILRYIEHVISELKKYKQIKGITTNVILFYLDFPIIILCMFIVIFHVNALEEDKLV